MIRRTAVVLLLATHAAAAHAADPPSDAYIQDAHGCRFWNPEPAPNETVRWSGACKDGFGDGFGKLEWFRGGQEFGAHEGSWERGRLLDGLAAIDYRTGSGYAGEVRDGKPHGHGIMWYANFVTYAGQWKDGRREGLGAVESYEGFVAHGEWKDNALSGLVTYSVRNGERYAGEFRNGERMGRGIFWDMLGKRSASRFVGGLASSAMTADEERAAMQDFAATVAALARSHPATANLSVKGDPFEVLVAICEAHSNIAGQKQQALPRPAP